MKFWILINCFCLPVWIWKGKNNIKFYFSLFTRHYIQRAGRADFGKNSYPLLTLVNFPRLPVCKPQSKWCVPTGFSRNCSEREKSCFFFPYLKSSWLSLLFAKAPHKYISSSRLKVLHCGHCNSKLYLAKLTCWFSLNFYFIIYVFYLPRPHIGPSPV